MRFTLLPMALNLMPPSDSERNSASCPAEPIISFYLGNQSIYHNMKTSLPSISIIAVRYARGVLWGLGGWGKGRQYAQARYHQVKNYKQTSILDQSKDGSRTVKSVSSVNRPAPHLAQV